MFADAQQDLKVGRKCGRLIDLHIRFTDSKRPSPVTQPARWLHGGAGVPSPAAGGSREYMLGCSAGADGQSPPPVEFSRRESGSALPAAIAIGAVTGTEFSSPAASPTSGGGSGSGERPGGSGGRPAATAATGLLGCCGR